MNTYPFFTITLPSVQATPAGKRELVGGVLMAALPEFLGALAAAVVVFVITAAWRWWARDDRPRLQREVRAAAQAARVRADAAYPEGYELSEDEESEAWRGTGG